MKIVNLKLVVSFSIVTLLSPIFSFSQPGSLDLSFSSDGKVTTAVGGTNGDGAQALAIQPDGKIVAIGYSDYTAYETFALVRYNSDGTLDNTFDNDGKVTTNIGGFAIGKAIAIQNDGKIVVAGYGTGSGGNDFIVMRYNSNGSLDNTFDSDGIVTTSLGSGSDYGNAIVIQSDGKIIVGGTSLQGNNTVFAAVRYNSNGTLDTSFNSDGIATFDISNSVDEGFSIAIQSTGKIIVSGVSRNGTNDDFSMVRFNADGSIDYNFGSNGNGKVTTVMVNTYESANAMAIQSDGKILLAGTSGNGTNKDFALFRYLSNGNIDNTFDTDGKVFTSIGNGIETATSMALQTDGKIVIAGFSDASTRDFAVIRYNQDGSLDSAFGSGGKVTTQIGTGADFGMAVAIQNNGKIVVGGYSNIGSSYNFSVVRYNGFISTGIESENDNMSSFKIFPNPGNSVFTIETTITDIIQIEVCNITGEKILSCERNDLMSRLDLSNFPTGVYFVNIIYGNNKYCKKIILE